MIIDLNKHVNEFHELIKNISYKHNGMFNNEIFLIYVLYKELNCDMFIESGVDNGVSTERFLKFIKDEYIAIDWNANCTGKNFNNENFYFTCADSTNLIPKLINERKNKNIFIMLDGPKNMEAAIFKNKLLEEDNVKIVAIHDTYDGLDNENHLRIFETKNNMEYSKKYFDLLNLKNDNTITTIYNLRNHHGQTYHETYPTGPGVSLYSKFEINFTL